ncbi:hypothetical protein LLF88_02050 [bacterium]|nr:hypothetical protein [bacterium]
MEPAASKVISGFEGDVLTGLPEEPCLQDTNVSLQSKRIDAPELTQ